MSLTSSKQNINSRRLKLLFTVSANPDFLMTAPAPILADRVLIQMLAGGSGMGLVYNDVPVTDPGGAQPTNANIATACGQPVQLAPATPTSPGGTYEDDPSSDPYNGVDIRTLAVGGTNAGDTILADIHLKI